MVCLPKYNFERKKIPVKQWERTLWLCALGQLPASMMGITNLLALAGRICLLTETSCSGKNAMPEVVEGCLNLALGHIYYCWKKYHRDYQLYSINNILVNLCNTKEILRIVHLKQINLYGLTTLFFHHTMSLGFPTCGFSIQASARREF